MGRSCIVCKSNYKNVRNNSLFRVPDNVDMFKRWQAAIPGEVKLEPSHFICAKHFDEKCIIRKYVKCDDNGKVIAEVPFKHPRLECSAVPTIFGNDAVTAQAVEEIGAMEIAPSLETSNEEAVKRQRLVSTAESSCEDIVHSVIQQQCLKADAPLVQATATESARDGRFDLSTVTIRERTHQQADSVEDRKFCSAVVPKSWSVAELSQGSEQRLIFSYVRTITKDGVDSPIIQKCVSLRNDKTLCYHVYGRLVTSKEAKLEEILNTTELLGDILHKFERMNVCNGIGAVNVHYLQVDSVFQDYLEQWHHKDCSLISKRKRCNNCLRLRKTQLQKEARNKKSKTLSRIFSSSNPIEKNKLIAMRKRSSLERRRKNRAKVRATLILQSLKETRNEMSRISVQAFEDKCVELDVPSAKKTALEKVMKAVTKKDARGRRYSDDWITLCVLMNIRSPGFYEFLRKNKVLPLPCTRTIRAYFYLCRTEEHSITAPLATRRRIVSHPHHRSFQTCMYDRGPKFVV